MSEPKILLLDIETSPKIACVWGLFKQNVGINQIVRDMYVLDWSAKWLGDDYMYSDSLHYHKLFDKEPENDKIILKSIWKMLDEADFVVGHNVKRFDLATLNSRFIQQGIGIPSTYRVIDTLTIARQNFKFTSNKLQFLGQALGVGSKIDTGGFDLWADIILRQDRNAFDRMVAYCEQDVYLLEDVYNKIKAWDKLAPALTAFGDLEEKSCNSCGSTELKGAGYYRTNTATYKKYTCKSCGHCMRTRQAEKTTKEQKHNLLRSI